MLITRFLRSEVAVVVALTCDRWRNSRSVRCYLRDKLMCNSGTGNAIPQKVPAVSRFCGRNIFALAEVHGHLADVYDDGV
jgi:hypothetical protein